MSWLSHLLSMSYVVQFVGVPLFFPLAFPSGLLLLTSIGFTLALQQKINLYFIELYCNKCFVLAGCCCIGSVVWRQSGQ